VLVLVLPAILVLVLASWGSRPTDETTVWQ